MMNRFQKWSFLKLLINKNPTGEKILGKVLEVQKIIKKEQSHINHSFFVLLKLQKNLKYL